MKAIRLISRRPFTRRGGRRLIQAVAGSSISAALLLAGPAISASASETSPSVAASCTSYGGTLYDVTVYGTDVQLRYSPECGGAAWFRLNGWNGAGTGTVQIQYETSTGGVVNGDSAILQESPYISTYATGYRYARIKFTNIAGGQYSFTGPWENIPISALAY